LIRFSRNFWFLVPIARGEFAHFATLWTLMLICFLHFGYQKYFFVSWTA